MGFISPRSPHYAEDGFVRKKQGHQENSFHLLTLLELASRSWFDSPYHAVWFLAAVVTCNTPFSVATCNTPFSVAFIRSSTQLYVVSAFLDLRTLLAFHGFWVKSHMNSIHNPFPFLRKLCIQGINERFHFLIPSLDNGHRSGFLKLQNTKGFWLLSCHCSDITACTVPGSQVWSYIDHCRNFESSYYQLLTFTSANLSVFVRSVWKCKSHL
jgi:hypothetical protein